MAAFDRRDWFHRLFGFTEEGYEKTQASFVVEEDAEEPWHVLRPGKPLDNMIGDVAAKHALPENRLATFQVASQFNCLEFVGPSVVPEDGITGYVMDRTQGPACSIACGPATVVRNYFAPLGGSVGQRRGRQINNLQDFLAELDELCNPTAPESHALGTAPFLRVRSGYTEASFRELQRLNRALKGLSEEQLDRLRGKLRIGLHEEVQVTSTAWGAKLVHPSANQLVTQVFGSACSVAYSRDSSRDDWEPVARLILEASYEATLLAALKQAIKHEGREGSNRVFLTCLGRPAALNPPAMATKVSGMPAFITDKNNPVGYCVQGAIEFGMDSRRLIQRCTKPDAKEFKKIAVACAIGFSIMGFIGYTVKMLGPQAMASLASRAAALRRRPTPMPTTGAASTVAVVAQPPPRALVDRVKCVMMLGGERKMVGRAARIVNEVKQLQGRWTAARVAWEQHCRRLKEDTKPADEPETKKPRIENGYPAADKEPSAVSVLVQDLPDTSTAKDLEEHFSIYGRVLKSKVRRVDGELEGLVVLSPEITKEWRSKPRAGRVEDAMQLIRVLLDHSHQINGEQVKVRTLLEKPLIRRGEIDRDRCDPPRAVRPAEETRPSQSAVRAQRVTRRRWDMASRLAPTLRKYVHRYMPKYLAAQHVRNWAAWTEWNPVDGQAYRALFQQRTAGFGRAYVGQQAGQGGG
eukprot:g33153.t1